MGFILSFTHAFEQPGERVVTNLLGTALNALCTLFISPLLRRVILPGPQSYRGKTYGAVKNLSKVRAMGGSLNKLCRPPAWIFTSTS